MDHEYHTVLGLATGMFNRPDGMTAVALSGAKSVNRLPRQLRHRVPSRRLDMTLRFAVGSRAGDWRLTRVNPADRRAKSAHPGRLQRPLLSQLV